MNTKPLLWSVGGIALIFAGYYGYRQYKLLKQTGFNVIETKKKGVTIDWVSLQLDAEIVNNSDLTFLIKNQSFDIYLNNKYVGKVTNANQLTINKKSSAKTSYDIGFDPRRVLKSGNIFDIYNGTISLKGGISVKSGIITAKVPFETSFTVKSLL